MTKLLPWLRYTLAFALGGATVLLAEAFERSDRIPQHLGPLLSGIGTCLGVLGAGIGWMQWGKRRTQEKQHDAAAETLAVLLDLAELLDQIARRYEEEGKSHEGRVRLLNELTDEEWRPRLAKVRALVQGQMPEATLECVADLWYRRRDMKQFLIREIEALDPQLDRGTLFGPKAVAAIEEETTEIRENLRPFLRHER